MSVLLHLFSLLQFCCCAIIGSEVEPTDIQIEVRGIRCIVIFFVSVGLASPVSWRGNHNQVVDAAMARHGSRILARSYALSWKPCQRESLNLPDHRSFATPTLVNDFGLIPFKFYNSWLLHENFIKVITDSWSSPTDRHLNLSTVIFKAKLKKLKLAFKLWRTTEVATETAAAMELREKIMEIDLRAEHSPSQK
ncbi:hypothetical protein Tco_1327582 [Tanacetum coccineum]